ncbi:MAG TPA: hypothetical protein VIV60_27715 [Polyangiaceae bacterium]
MAHALKFHALVTGKTLPLPDLGAFEGKRVEVIVVEDEGLPPGHQDPTLAKQRPVGLYRGQRTTPEDVDAPLPTDVQKYLDGEDDGH